MLLVVLCATLISSVSSTQIPSPLRFFKRELAARKPRNAQKAAPANTPFAITGVKDETGSVHPRLDIRSLQKNKDLWNLYLLGLVRMQAVPQDDKLSWYQIGSK